MNEPSSAAPASVADAGRSPAPLAALFFAGGCAALIYEIVWFQVLELVVGSSAISLAILLGTYMGGMGLGSLLLPRLIPTRRHPLRVYALLEAVIGTMGIAILTVLPAVSRLYAGHEGRGAAGLLLRGALAAVCLLPPTAAMGATLPAASRWLETAPRGVAWMGFLYGTNTAGAVAGCGLAGFYLLRVYDVRAATFVAAAINGAVALSALILAARRPHRQSSYPARPSNEITEAGPRSRTILVAIALSGMCALGAEVVWTRLLSLMLGGTVYAFSIILAVFLGGLGIGGGIGALLARGKTSPRKALAVCQILLTGAIAWTAFLLAWSLPFWPINPSLSRNPWLIFQLDIVRCAWAVFAPACLWGASFPLALAAVVYRGRDAGRSVGRVYASNTAGAIVGAVAFSLAAVPILGTQNSQRLMIALSAAAALVALAPLLKTKTSADTVPAPAALLALTAVLAGSLAWSVPRTPWGIIAWGRSLPAKAQPGIPLYVGEGMSASVAVTRLDNGIVNFHVSGKVEASTDPTDMRLQRMLGLIPGLLHPKARSVLIVGCGAGVTAGMFVRCPGVERIVICEIEPLIPRIVARYFAKENNGVVDDPRVEIVIDDARHYILTTRETFDIITSDPIHPWVKGSAALYSREYFELCRAHLKPGGFITQWVPLYESTPETVKSELATFFSVFPRGTVWGNDIDGLGYDVVLLGQDGPLRIDLNALEARAQLPEYERLAESMREVGFASANDLFSTYAGQGPDLRGWLADAQINRDRNMRLQYLAGLGENTAQSIGIYEEILRFRRFPEDILSGTGPRVETLRELIRLKSK